MKRLFTDNTLENIGAFISGDIVATIVVFGLMKDVALPIFLAVLTGLCGGAAALLGKDLYKWLKKKIIK